MVDKNCYLYYSEEPGRFSVLHQCFENLVLNLDGPRHGRASANSNSVNFNSLLTRTKYNLLSS